jgi:nucleotide-binding universal stress UspA family protein
MPEGLGSIISTPAGEPGTRIGTMLKNILIGLDGSPYSTSATELGIQWAHRFGALLVGLGVIDEPSIRGPEPVPLGGAYYKRHRDDIRMHEARVQVEQFLERFALRCSEAGVPFKLLEDVGLPWEQILVEAQRYDLILLGQQTYFHFETQQSPCETLHKVLKNSPRPVVTAPERPSSGSAVLVAYDSSLQAARALQAFQASGLHEGQKLHIVSVAENHVEAARHAGRAAEFLRFHEIHAHVHPLCSSAPPAEAILDQVRRLNASLLVMGAYGQPTLREFFLGSATRTVLKESQVPLFLYH